MIGTVRRGARGGICIIRIKKPNVALIPKQPTSCKLNLVENNVKQRLVLKRGHLRGGSDLMSFPWKSLSISGFGA